MTPYEILGVAHFTPINEIRLAYKRAIQKCHPDRAQHMTAEEFEATVKRSQDLFAAWQTLRDPDKRAALDRSLAGGEIGHNVMSEATAATMASAPDVDGVCSACKGEGVVRVFENRFAWMRKPCPKGCKVSK